LGNLKNNAGCIWKETGPFKGPVTEYKVKEFRTGFVRILKNQDKLPESNARQK
jgi:hypothetical protein